MTTSYQKAAAELTEDTRRRMLLSKTSRVSIAEQTGYNRQTVTKYIEHANDMPLTMFIAAQHMGGGDPVKAFTEALRQNGITAEDE